MIAPAALIALYITGLGLVIGGGWALFVNWREGKPAMRQPTIQTLGQFVREKRRGQ